MVLKRGSIQEVKTYVTFTPFPIPHASHCPTSLFQTLEHNLYCKNSNLSLGEYLVLSKWRRDSKWSKYKMVDFTIFFFVSFSNCTLKNIQNFTLVFLVFENIFQNFRLRGKWQFIFLHFFQRFLEALKIKEFRVSHESMKWIQKNHDEKH